MRRRGKWLLLAVIFFVLACCGWAGWNARQARSDLLQVQGAVSQLQTALEQGNTPLVDEQLPVLRRDLRRAATRTTGWTWAVARHVPVLGRSYSAVARATEAGRVLGDQALPESAAAMDLVRTRAVVRNGRIDLSLLAELERHVQQAATASSKARRLVDSDTSLVLNPVGRAVASARARVDRLDDALTAASKALRLAPSMLGSAEPRRYYVAVQNPAEARATGGLVGAYALFTARNGTITLDHAGTNTELKVATKQVPYDPAAAKTWTDIGSRLAWFDANLTPHFPDAAMNLAGQWQAQSGQVIDGVLALDPLVMGELLKATGPVTLPDGTSITADNVLPFVGHDEYVRYPDVPARKALLSGLAAILFKRVIAPTDSLSTLRAFVRASGSGHLYLWSRHADEQRVIGTGLVGGALPKSSAPYLSVLTQNYSGDKLDYFTKRTVRVTPLDDGFLRVETTLRNTVPLGEPLYVTVRSDRPEPPVPYGQNKTGFSVYGALTSEVRAFLVDGKPQSVLYTHDHGHRIGTVTLELPRNQDVRVVVEISQPRGELTYRQQPLVDPGELDIQVPHRVVGR